jgi:hypothetical protein
MRHKRSATPGCSSTFTVLSFASSRSTELSGKLLRSLLNGGTHELAKGRQRLVGDRVVDRVPDPASSDHPGAQQAGQVLGDVGPCHPGDMGQSGDRLLTAFEQRMQDPQPGGVREESEPASDLLDHLIGDSHGSS